MVKTRIALAAASALLAGSGTVAAATPAWADYGPGAVYQIELSANVGGPDGGGVWLWIGLNSDHSGDYAGSDCGHGLGAVADRGDVQWSYSADGKQVIITGVTLNGLGGFPATVTVPAKTGHYPGTVGSFITLPAFIPAGIGTSQLQVAP
jgi:hypothetical protein